VTPQTATIIVATLFALLLLAGAWAIYEMRVAPEGDEDEHGHGPVNPRQRKEDDRP